MRPVNNMPPNYLGSLLTTPYLLNMVESHLNLVLVCIDLGQLMVDHQPQIMQAARGDKHMGVCLWEGTKWLSMGVQTN